MKSYYDKNMLTQLLYDLSAVSNRQKPGQVTHKIAEIEVFIEEAVKNAESGIGIYEKPETKAKETLSELLNRITRDLLKKEYELGYKLKLGNIETKGNGDTIVNFIKN